ncbi:MAG: diguanylate cyclase [Gammaproteobacteria bacterium]|nr:diguanylate cyclase [Gammaproteobacteria bacterium]NNF49768.1 diguanylate cyclase [Woeseiaceae bacterium]
MIALVTIVPLVLAVFAVLYLGLAVYVAHATRKSANVLISGFLALIACYVASAALCYGATDASLFGIGRVLTLFSAGFIPVMFFLVYREYTVGAPHPAVVAVLSIIPVATTVLALTNAQHGMIWSAVETETGLVFSAFKEHAWYTYVHVPFAYSLFAYAAFAIIVHLPMIAPAHRRIIGMMLTCALLPYAVNIANNFLGMGPPDFPFTASSLALLFPFMAYVSLKLRVHEFSPLAYKTLFDHVRDPIVVVDTNQAIICANRAAEELLGGKEKELIGRGLWDEFPVARDILEQAKELDLTQTLRIDSSKTYEVSVGPLTARRGQQVGMVVVCRDVTEKRKAQIQLADSEHLVRTLIETSSNGILRFARDGDTDDEYRCVFANRSAETFVGGKKETLVGARLDELEQLDPGRLSRHFNDHDKKRTQLSFEVRTKHGKLDFWLRIVAEPVGADFSLTLIDITSRKREEDKMMTEALCDPLTGVLNRRGFEQEAKNALRGTSDGAVLYLDLNHFKTINDRFGHKAGDALLKAFGHRLEFCLRPEDVLGRLGGDEFAIVLPDVGLDDVRRIAERLVRTASEAYIIQGQEITCTASVGIALIPTHGQDLWHLLDVADEAMYAAKAIPDEEAANDRAAYVEAATAS